MNEQFTKKQIAEIVLWYADDYAEEECPYNAQDYVKDNITCVDAGVDIVEYKTVYNSNVYLIGGVYFEVTCSRSNSGYWSDSERDEPTICEVFPQEVTKTIYLAKKPD